jgi:hypothetical protein
MATLRSTLLIVLALLATMTRGARKLEIEQLATYGSIVSAT